MTASSACKSTQDAWNRSKKGNPQDNDIFCVERGVADNFKRNLFA